MARFAWENKKTASRVCGESFDIVVSPADSWVSLMERQTRFQDAALAATYALRVDPGCIEAHLFLAGHSRDAEDEEAHLAKAVSTGEALWAPVAASRDDFAWWGVTATRPYMRAIKALADWHALEGSRDKACELYGRLLEMNPVDSQGVRYSLEEVAEQVPGLGR